MNFYIAYGTSSYLELLKSSIHEGSLLALQNENTAILMHETNGKSYFKEGKNYEIIDSSGAIVDGKFAVLNNIPVTEEGRPVFEYRFKNRARLIEKEPGFVAIRVLRPLHSDTYIILTLWENEISFKDWQQSQAYNKAHEKREKREVKQSIFARPSYVSTYYQIEEE